MKYRTLNYAIYHCLGIGIIRYIRKQPRGNRSTDKGAKL